MKCDKRYGHEAEMRPLAAELTPANVADNEQAPTLLREIPVGIRYLLGDTHYNDPALRTLCAACDRELVTTRRGAYPHTDGGRDLRLRRAGGQVPTRGLLNTQRFILGAVLVYQLSLWYRFEAGQDLRDLRLRTGLKAFLKAA